MTLPYCGNPPLPSELLTRWNLGPGLLCALLLCAGGHVLLTRGAYRKSATCGWIVAALAFASPLCALSVSLFSARVGQHMILTLIAAPLIGIAIPRTPWRGSIWWSALAFTVALWVWHMPAPYEATFRSTLVYWAMHATLFGSAIWLWHDVLNHDSEETMRVLAAGTFVSIQMGLLGAILTLSSHAMFAWHYFTTQAWGLTPLADQQLGGTLMWVPGSLFFLASAMRSLLLLGGMLDRTVRP